MESIRQSRPSVLFIIGNGFDLGLGMKTSYSDIYESYIKALSSSAAIEKFKNDLRQRKPYDKWSDFEMGMAEYAKTLNNENELIECVRDFKKHMVEHLEAENERMVSKFLDDSQAVNVVYEWENSLNDFYSSFAPNIVNQFQRVLGKAKPIYHFITFNYTEILEAIFSAKEQLTKIKTAPPLHIHGMLCQDVVLGVDNADQLKDLPYISTKRTARAFIKTFFNWQYDANRILAARNMISESNVICTYGFSWGESDKTWIDQLIKWLKENPDHHLVVYQYDTNRYDRFNFDEMMDVEEDKKDRFMKRIGIENDELMNQIHIPIGDDIFNFEFCEKLKDIPNMLPVSQ